MYQIHSVHISRISYLIILSTVVRDMLVLRAVCHCKFVPSTCKTFSVFDVGGTNICLLQQIQLSKNRSIRGQNYVTAARKIFIYQFDNFTQLESKFSQLQLLKFLCWLGHFQEIQKKTKVGVFFLLRHCTTLQCFNVVLCCGSFISSETPSHSSFCF